MDDFSVLVRKIPIHQKDYDNNPELLKAMIVTHLEEILKGESQAVEDMEEV